MVGETGSGKPVCNTVPRARDSDLDRIRELPYRPATVCRRTRGRTDGSIRPRARTILMFSPCPDGGVHGCCMDPQVALRSGPT
jgi:hypothetical protein